MGKFVYAVITAFLIEAALYWFAGATYATTSLFNFVLNPIETNAFYILILGIVVALGAGIVASAWISINVFGVYAVAGAGLLLFFASISHLATFVYGELSGALSAEWAVMIAALVTAPFVITYLLAVAEWVRANS